MPRKGENIYYFSLNEHNPELFITDFHDSTPCFSASLAVSVQLIKL